jgi:hypothetical protein
MMTAEIEIKHQDCEKNEGVRRCSRCVMPESYPGITFDDEGVCNYCRNFDKQWGFWINNTEEQARSEVRLRGIFEAAKRKGKRYDAILGLSGGKDSSYCLYLCREVYGLNVLTCTRDNGLMSEEGKKRVKQVVETFNVPHLYYQDPLATELVGIFMRKTGNFCTPCELWSFNIHAMLAREYDIPLIILGHSTRSDGAPPKYLNPWDPWYFSNVLKGEDYRERLRCSVYARNYVIREGLSRALGHRRIVLPADYLVWNEEQIAQLFQQKYGILFGEEHSDCIADKVKDYVYAKKCGGASPKVVKYCQLVRAGMMTREGALEKVRKLEEAVTIPGLDRFLEVTGMSLQEFEAASQKSPAAYTGGVTQVFNNFRKMIRRQTG